MEVKKEQTKLENTTDIPTQHIKDIINFVKPNNLPTHKFTIRVTNSRKMPTGASGWCYYDGLNGYAKKPEDYHRPHIVIRLAPYTEGYPYKSEPNKPLDKEDVAKGLVKRSIGGGYLDHLILNKEEALIHTIAHEIRHLWQKNHTTKRGKVWGARGKYSDRDAIRKVREWRRIHNPKQVYPHLNWT